MHVKYDGQHKMIDNHIDSGTKFYMTVILDRCEYRMEPVTRGSTLFLTFNLKWDSFKTEMPRGMAEFLMSMKEVGQVFQSWTPETDVNLNSAKGTKKFIWEMQNLAF